MDSISIEWVKGESLSSQPEMTASPPPGTVVYAIGDVHGTLDLLEALQEGVARDIGGRQADRSVIIYLGDYLSRGNGARQVVERVLTWRPQGGRELCVVALKGNHEDMTLRYLVGDLEMGRHVLDYGGLETLASYGVEVADPGARDEESLEHLRIRLVEAIPREHLEFLQGLKTSHREGGYYFAHAGVRPGIALGEQSDKDHMWIRTRFLESQADHGAIVVHGHSMVPHPQLHHSRIAVDTGAYKSGTLTCAVLEGGERAFLQARRQ